PQNKILTAPLVYVRLYVCTLNRHTWKLNTNLNFIQSNRKSAEYLFVTLFKTKMLFLQAMQTMPLLLAVNTVLKMTVFAKAFLNVPEKNMHLKIKSVAKTQNVSKILKIICILTAYIVAEVASKSRNLCDVKHASQS